MKKYKVAIVGCGGMANQWVDYALQRENVKIVALVDVVEENAKAMALKKSLTVPVFTNLIEALEETDADLVFDVTIPETHKDIVTTALKAGCHVFGEKPMATSLEDAKEIIDVAKQTGKSYSVMQNRRYIKQIRSLESFIDTGAIGEVGSIHADFFLGPHFGGFREKMDHPLIVDMAIHTFDQARFISNSDPVSVYCHEYNPPGSWFEGNASAICIFEMCNGTVFNYRGSWCSDGFDTSWESEWRVTGTKGSVQWDGTNTPKCEVIDKEKATEFLSPKKRLEVPILWEGKEGHVGCLDEMFNALEKARPAETDCNENIKSLAMVFGATESARKGKKVSIHDLLD